MNGTEHSAASLKLRPFDSSRDAIWCIVWTQEAYFFSIPITKVDREWKAKTSCVPAARARHSDILLSRQLLQESQEGMSQPSSVYAYGLCSFYRWFFRHSSKVIKTWHFPFLYSMIEENQHIYLNMCQALLRTEAEAYTTRIPLLYKSHSSWGTSEVLPDRQYLSLNLHSSRSLSITSESQHSSVGFLHIAWMGRPWSKFGNIQYCGFHR